MNIYLIVENIRSAHNVGSILRTAEGIGVTEVMLCGYTPYPLSNNDDRLPYIAEKVSRKIEKTALGASTTQKWRYVKDVNEVINTLRNKNIKIIGLEQHHNSVLLQNFKCSNDIALVLGNEITGISLETLSLCDQIVEIPMTGTKESFNVVNAAAMALFYLKYML